MTTPVLPAVHSVLSPVALAELVGRQYGCLPGSAPDVAVTFLSRNISDTYLVTGVAGYSRAILRVYRTGWRSLESVAWELALIEQVAGRVAVARPIARQDELLCGELQAIEGPRLYALFEFAAGRSPTPDAADAALFGRTAAEFHRASQDFPEGERFDLDLVHLITEPLRAIERFLSDDPDTRQALQELAQRTHQKLAELAPYLEWGACHGDLHEGNAHISEQGTLRLFDFDCAGPGWRAYDLAVYWWSQVSNSAKTPEQAQAAWEAFLAAYQEVRPLPPADLRAIAFFVLARSFWFMGLYADLTPEKGRESLSEGFFRSGLDFMQRFEAQHLPDAGRKDEQDAAP